MNNRLVVSNLNYLQYSRIYNVIPGRYRITVYQGKRHALASGRYLDELPAESGLYSCPDSFRFQFPASDILVLTY
ncbi:MAG: hypothetical protein ACLTW9_00590 [Enterocloster sp.]